MDEPAAVARRRGRRERQPTCSALTILGPQTGRRSGLWVTARDLRMGDAAGPAAHLWRGDEPVLPNIGTMRLSRQWACKFRRRLICLFREFEGDDIPGGTSSSMALMFVRSAVD
ncbi:MULTISPECIES: hypothetical protein [Deinococcus]|uniref:Uncharacterized protein n=1 Tax=Deinococcus rufus TaxID=2136097 RepID=A0ABV7ZBY1_9DEIO|nr:hypothetical protein [Deinococcus sp. AB2017081]WQE95703.1 hypothetical protein U2P90_02130 [Deinococcus sp. AB2017081]